MIYTLVSCMARTMRIRRTSPCPRPGSGKVGHRFLVWHRLGLSQGQEHGSRMPASQREARWHRWKAGNKALAHGELCVSAHRRRGLEGTGRRDGGQATRRSATTGRCLRPASNVTASSSRTPGLPRASRPHFPEPGISCGVPHPAFTLRHRPARGRRRPGSASTRG